MKTILYLTFLFLVSNVYSNQEIELFKQLRKSESTFTNKEIIKKLESRQLNDSLTTELSFYKAKTLYMESNFTEALTLFKKTEVEFAKQKLQERVIETKVYGARTLKKMGKLDEALKILLSIESAKIKDKSEIYFTLSIVYYDFVEINKAIIYAQKAEEEALKNNNLSTLAQVYNMFSVIYNSNNDNEKGILFCKKSLALSIRLKNYMQIVLMHNNLSYFYSQQKNYKEALVILEQAKKYFQYTNSDYLQNYNAILTAKNKFKLGAIEEALDISNHTIQETEQKGLNEILAIALILNGDIYFSKNNPLEAEHYFQKAYTIASKNFNFDAEQEALEKLIQVTETTKQYEKNISFLKQLMELKEKIFKSEKEKELKLLEIKNNIAKYEKEIKYKNQQIEVLNLKNIKNNYQFLALGILVLGLIFFIYRQKKINAITEANAKYIEEINELKQKTLENKVSFTSNQIVEFAIQIQDQNKLFQDFKTKLSQLLTKLNDKEKTTAVKNLLFDLNTAIEHNNDKIKLNTEIDKATDEFLFNLKEKHPDLNEKEIQILSYLRMNYQTKQIASLLSITNQSVNNYRFSIRKKLNLTKEESLQDYLKTI